MDVVPFGLPKSFSLVTTRSESRRERESGIDVVPFGLSLPSDLTSTPVENQQIAERGGSGMDVVPFGLALPRREAVLTDPIGGLSALDILHLRWGHMSENNIKYAVRKHLYESCPVTYEQIKDLKLRLCASCKMGTMKAFARNKLRPKDRYEIMECLAVDYKGPFSTHTVHHCSGFYLISDHRSQAVWVYPCQDKSEDTLYKIMESFFDLIKMLPCPHPRILHCDDDSVETGGLISRYVRAQGLEMHVSTPHIHSQNGQIERAMQSMLDKTRVLLIAGGAPLKYWDYAALYAAYLLMRTPNLKNEWTPYETITRVTPSVKRLLPFFCPGLYYLTREERHSSWDPKAQRCRFLGFDDTLQTCYKIVCVPSGKILSRQDCIFDPALLREMSYEKEEPDSDDADRYIEFDNPDLATDSDGNLLGDNIAPYFALDPVQYEIQKQLDMDYAHFTVECFENDLIQREVGNLYRKGTIVPAEEQNGPAMKTKIVLKYTYDDDYELRRKARFVVCGYSQIKDRDYGETYAPTTSNAVTNIVIQTCVANGWYMASFDVKSAFLEGPVDRKLYARLPKFLDPNQGRVEIKGNWYGLKQGPRIWNDQLNSILLKLGFERCPVHPCLYKRLRNEVLIIMSIHVDDGLMGCSHEAEFDDFIKEFEKHVEHATVSNKVLKFTGTTMDVNRAEGWVRLSHSVYIKQRWTGRKAKPTPMRSGVNLRTAEPDPEGPSLLSDTGSFRFIADRARPDILTAVGEVSTGGSKNASEEHVLTSERIKDYLCATPDLYIQLGGLGKLAFFGYCDAAYITDGNAKSRLGGCVFMNWSSGTIFSFSRNDTSSVLLKQFVSAISHSSTEAEIKAIDVLIHELLHMLDLARFVSGEQELPIKIFSDNKSAKQLKGHGGQPPAWVIEHHGHRALTAASLDSE
eukprot:gene32431-biopygen27626